MEVSLESYVLPNAEGVMLPEGRSAASAKGQDAARSAGFRAHWHRFQVLTKRADGLAVENRATGRRYGIKLDALDHESLREFHRPHRDLDREKEMAVRKARL